MILVGIMALFLVSCAAGHGSISQPPEGEYVTGYVFEDSNNNGIMDKGEKGIPGVLVSNQREVVKTDRNGRYHLPLEENTTIFVVKPANYQLPVNDDNLPLFYYLHYTEGSPEGLKFPGIEPTGDIPDYVNFPLLAEEDPDTIEVMALGDPQPRTDEELDFLREGLVNEVRDENLTFGWVLGDLMFDDLSLFPRYNQIMGHLGIPLYNVIGNHDIDFEGDELHAKDNFRLYFGPNYYAFTYGKFHFFSIDNIEWLGKQTENFWGDYRGVIGKQQMHWIASMLEHIPDDEWIVMGTHIPLYTARSDRERNNTVDRNELFALLEGRKNVLTLSAHMHTNEYYFLGPDEGWHGEEPLVHIVCGAGSGAWWGGPMLPEGYPYSLQSDGVPSGYYKIQFKGNGYIDQFIPLAKDPDFQIRISTPRGKIFINELDGREIVASIFMGSEKTNVNATINGEINVPMERTVRRDPFAVEFFTEHAETLKSWVGASPAVHIWSGKLPDDLETGVHVIDVEAHLHDGRIFTERQVFEIID